MTAPCVAQVNSQWELTPISTDWFSPSNWSDGVPNGFEDAATLTLVQQSDPLAVELSANLKLQRLLVAGVGAINVSGVGNLEFAGAENTLSMMETVTRVDISTQISASSSPLEVVVPSDSALSFSGEVFSGDFNKSGEGALLLSSENSRWNGNLTVSAGDLVVADAEALGSTDGVTRLSGGRVIIHHDSAEPFVLESGILDAAKSYLELRGALSLAPANNAIIRGSFVINGGTQGTGDLFLQNDQSPAKLRFDGAAIAHTGGVVVGVADSLEQASVRFRTDNTYSGATTVVNSTLETATANGLGDIASGTSATNSTLRIHAASREALTLDGSRLQLWSSEENVAELRYGGIVSLQNSTVSSYGEHRGAGNYVFAQTVDVTGTNVIETDRGDITFAQGIRGDGKLVFEPTSQYPVHVRGIVSPEIDIVVAGPVSFDTPNAIQGDVLLENSGRIIISAPQSLNRIYTTEDAGHVEVADGVTLDVQSIAMNSGSITGSVNSSTPFDFYGFNNRRTISHVDAINQANVWAGELVIDDSIRDRSKSLVAISLRRPVSSSVRLAAESTSIADISLNGGSGINFRGALLSTEFRNGSTATIQGNVDLGDGATIGGDGRLRIEGAITGGDLFVGTALRGDFARAETSIVGGEAAYTGVTAVQEATLIIAENGRLTNTSTIELNHGGRIIVDSNQQTVHIADAIEVVGNGGEISVWSSGPNTERIDRLSLRRGQTSAAVTIGQLDREVGTTLNYYVTNRRDAPAGRSPAPLVLENPPAVVNGILPPWINGYGSFATLDSENRVVSPREPFVLLADANETSNVQLRTPETFELMSEDKTVHSLSMPGGAFGPFDMNGHTFTIASGGLHSPDLVNGTVAPGVHANNELIISSDFVMNANIHDTDQPTHVTYLGSGKIGGQNSYSGATYFSGEPGSDVQIESDTGVPKYSDVTIVGTDISFRYAGNIELGKVEIHAADLHADWRAFVTAEEIEVTSGFLSAPLAGNFPIRKTTNGDLYMSAERSEFTGTIDVLGGSLHLGGKFANDGIRPLGQGEVTIHKGASLTVWPGRIEQAANQPTIRLAGGSLYGGGSGESTLPVSLSVVDDSSIYLLDGSSSSPRQSPIKIDGQIIIDAGATLSVNGFSNASNGLEVSEGIVLGSGARLAGVGSLKSTRVVIADGARIAPGNVEVGDTIGTLAFAAGNFLANPLSHVQFGPGGVYEWEINDAGGDPGSLNGEGWDLLRIEGDLGVDATPASPFVFRVKSVGDGGEIKNFDVNASYEWSVAEITTDRGGIIDFGPKKFVFDLEGLRNTYPQLSAGQFSIAKDGASLVLRLNAPIEVQGDFNGNGMRDVADLDLIAEAISSGDTSFDLNGDGTVTFEDRRMWVESLANTFIGDSNFDGQFDSSDFVAVFASVKYETNEAATWSEGDWNGDGIFDSGDFVSAFVGGGYESGPREGGLQTVPEPATIALMLFGLCGVTHIARRKWKFESETAEVVNALARNSHRSFTPFLKEFVKFDRSGLCFQYPNAADEWLVAKLAQR